MCDIKSIFKKDKNIVMLTCYDFTFASLIDQVRDSIDAILVGDSLACVMQGEDSTVFAELDDIIYHSRCVRKGTQNSFIVADLPFMSYQTDVREAVKNAGKLIKYGRANAVKLEGGIQFEENIRSIVSCGIPVMGHVGLTPQFVNEFGGHKVQGRDSNEQDRIINDALAAERAGAFAVVLECVPGELAEKITNMLKIPTIGIGAGKVCDGQVMVLQDMLGMNSNNFKFVKKYSDLNSIIKDALINYSEEVRSGVFPDKKHTFK